MMIIRFFTITVITSLFIVQTARFESENEALKFIQPSVIQLSDSCQGKLIHFSLNPVPPAGSSITCSYNDPSSGINNTAVGHKPTHTFFNKGSYTVQASVAFNGNVENSFHTVRIESCVKNAAPSSECQLKASNSFTPNGDGKNDEYIHQATCSFEKYELSIFNRWGQIMFKSTDPTEKWNGKADKADCPDGQYLYLYKYTFVGQEAKTLNGYVTLLR